MSPTTTISIESAHGEVLQDNPKASEKEKFREGMLTFLPSWITECAEATRLLDRLADNEWHDSTPAKRTLWIQRGKKMPTRDTIPSFLPSLPPSAPPSLLPSLLTSPPSSRSRHEAYVNLRRQQQKGFSDDLRRQLARQGVNGQIFPPIEHYILDEWTKVKKVDRQKWG